MKRRAFSTAAALGSALLGAARLAHAQGPVPQNGKDYLTLSQRAPVDTPPGKVELIEFFWYSCPHCNAFEPQFDAWAKSAASKDVAVRRMPIAFRDDFVPQQKLYFALEAMGKLDDVHRKVFYAIHAEKNNLATDAAVLGWIEKIGLDKKSLCGRLRFVWSGLQGQKGGAVAGCLQNHRGAVAGCRRTLLHRRGHGRIDGACPAGCRIPDRSGSKR